MPGIRERVVLQARDTKLLSALESFRVVDRVQAMEVAGFTSIPRANARLLKLTRAGLLRRSFVGASGPGHMAVYRLPHPRSEFRGKLIQHQLALNAVRIAFEKGPAQVNRFLTFSRPLSWLFPIIPDGYLELNNEGKTTPLFLEVDLGTEPGKVLRAKAEAYRTLALSGDFERCFRYPRFRVVVVTTSERRARGIASAIRPVTDKLFFISTLPIIKSTGPYASIWLRPDGREGQPLL